MAPKAASIAATLEETFDDADVTISIGKLGQFEILIDGQTLAKRSGKLYDKLKGRTIPTPEQVVELIRATS